MSCAAQLEVSSGITPQPDRPGSTMPAMRNCQVAIRIAAACAVINWTDRALAW